MIHVCRDGTITYRDAKARQKVFNGVALPVASCDSEAEAQALIVRFGRRQYVEHPKLPGQPWYKLGSLPDRTPLLRLLEVDELDGIGEMFQKFFSDHADVDRLFNQPISAYSAAKGPL